MTLKTGTNTSEFSLKPSTCKLEFTVKRVCLDVVEFRARLTFPIRTVWGSFQRRRLKPVRQYLVQMIRTVLPPRIESKAVPRWNQSKLLPVFTEYILVSLEPLVNQNWMVATGAGFFFAS